MTLSASGEGTAKRGLQVFLALVGAVALGAGIATVLFGAGSLPDTSVVSATADSELRFYAVWYAAAGAVLLRAARRVESDATAIRGIAALFFVAGCARGLSWVVEGRPHQLMVVLMIVELGLPLVIVPWQALVARRSDPRIKGKEVMP